MTAIGGDWAAGYVQTAVEIYIVGYEDNTFRPSNKLQGRNGCNGIEGL